MPYRKEENWRISYQREDGQNNDYYIFPKDKQSFWTLAEKHGGILLRFIGKKEQPLPCYEHIITVSKHPHQSDVGVFLRTSTINNIDISKLFKDTIILAAPKGLLAVSEYKIRDLTDKKDMQMKTKNTAQTNKNLSLKELCQEYKNWITTDDYQEGYKWDFISQFKDTFSQINLSDIFTTKYLKLLSFNENFTPRDIMMGNKFFKDIFMKYPHEHIELFRYLFNETLPLNDRINHFTNGLDLLRTKEHKIYPIHYQVALFFLFVQNPRKYPLATTNEFIKNYFLYTNIIEANKLKGVDLYIFFYQHIITYLLPLLQKELNTQCSVMDAQDFCWFIGKHFFYGHKSSTTNIYAYIPREIKEIKENPLDEEKYIKEINTISLTKEEQKELEQQINKPPTRNQILQDKINRNPKIAKLALSNAHFNCEIDEGHPSFISRASKNPYMEAHHLIPLPYSMTFYERYHINLDCPENIISLCPTCHRALHFGTDTKRNEILKILLKKRKKQLNALGIQMTLSELIQLY